MFAQFPDLDEYVCLFVCLYITESTICLSQLTVLNKNSLNAQTGPIVFVIVRVVIKFCSIGSLSTYLYSFE